MITARDLLLEILIENNNSFDISKDKEITEDVLKATIEFAKMHVVEALRQASENFIMRLKDNAYELDMNDDWMEVDRDSILNAYPLENIK